MFFLLFPGYKHRICAHVTHTCTRIHTHTQREYTHICTYIRTHTRIHAHTRAPMDTHTHLLSNTSKIEEMTYLLYLFKSILPNELWISADLLLSHRQFRSSIKVRLDNDVPNRYKWLNLGPLDKY